MAPRPTLEYPKGPLNTTKRHAYQAQYDLNTVHSVINTTPVLHISFQPDPDAPFPAILPMIGQMGSFSRPSASISDTLDCYLHGYVSSRIMNLSRAAVASGSPGLPVCISAAKVDGLVLSLTPNSHSYNYRSSILFGHATLVTDVEEKLWAMELVTNGVVPGRYVNTRVPPNAAEMASTQVLRVVVHSASSKTREGVPADAAGDVADEGLVDRVWTGVVPVYQVLGEPIPSPYNRVEQVPEHVETFVRESNEEALQYATAAGKKAAPVKPVRSGGE